MNRELLTRKTLSCDLAHRMIAAAQREAAELGVEVTVSVVDDGGVLRAFSRMDRAPLMAVGVSRKKALTAVGFGLPSGDWYDFIKDDPVLLHGVGCIDDFSLLGGGLPVVVEGEVVGAVGVSGAHHEQDAQCARAALAVVKRVGGQ